MKLFALQKRARGFLEPEQPPDYVAAESPAEALALGLAGVREPFEFASLILVADQVVTPELPATTLSKVPA